MKRQTIFFLSVLPTVFLPIHLKAKEIVEVRISIPLSESEARLKDYYISTEGVDLKLNQVVRVQRKVTVTPPGKKSIGDVEVDIGQLKIIGLSGKVAIAREYKLFDRSERPLTEAIGIMLGDTIDTKDSFVDKNSRKPNSEEEILNMPKATPALEEPQAVNREPNATAEPVVTLQPRAEIIIPVTEFPGTH